MTRPGSKLEWCLTGFCLIGMSLYFYLGEPPIQTSQSQIIKRQLVSESVAMSDLLPLTINRSPETNDTILQSLLSLPQWYRSGDWGLKNNESLKIRQKNYPKGEDDEVKIAWNNFFYGTTKGIVLELGALDGKKLSVSQFFETEARWRSILIEGNPGKAALIPKNRPNAINFNAVICEKPGIVHFAQGGPVSGIVEFMTKGHLKSYHRNLLTNGALDNKKLAKSKKVTKVPCVPLSQILYLLKIYHINFFMLDVEGGELNVLKAIDFGRIKFDVIAVETARKSESKEGTKNYADSVVQFITSKGYVLWNRKMGRNSWFRHPDFTGFSSNLTILSNFTRAAKSRSPKKSK